MRFTLIDRITSIEPGKSITAVKNLSLAEEYLGDHFPGFPVMPGVLMIEAMVQTASWLMRLDDDFAFSNILLKSAKAVKFSNFVTPGKSLCITLDSQGCNGNEWSFKGIGTIDGESAVSAKITLTRFNLAEQDPRLKSTDEELIQSARTLFAQLWADGAKTGG